MDSVRKNMSQFVLPVLIGIILIALIVMIVFDVALSNRLQTVEDKLTYAPPASYTPPDLDKMEVSDPPKDLVVRRSVYVPAYSHIYYQKGRPFLLEVTLSIRNTDLHKPVFIHSVRYYDTRGNLRKTFVDRLIRLSPLETIEFLVKEHDSIGGSGANFMVDWTSQAGVHAPVIEAVMFGNHGTLGVAFARSGYVLTPSTNPGAKP